MTRNRQGADRLRIVLYARISKDRNGTKLGVQRQLEDGRAFADEIDAEVVGVFVDNDISASDGSFRPKYEEMLALGDCGGYDYLWGYSLSRLWRSRDERGPAINRLGRAHGRRGIVLEVNDSTYNLGTAKGRTNAAKDGENDTFELEQLQERVTREVKQRANMGRPHTGLGYGWTRVATLDENGRAVGKYVVNEHEAAVLDVTTRVAQGISLASIARGLNDKGEPTPEGGALGWTGQSVSTLIRRPSNVAKRVHQQKLIDVEVDWPALVPLDVWMQACDLLCDPARRVSQTNKARHLLSGKQTGFCGVCDGPLRMMSRQSRQPYYSCASHGHVSRPSAFVDELTASYVSELIRHPEIWQRDAHALGEAKAKVARIKAELDANVRALAAGGMAVERVLQYEKDMQAQLVEAEAEQRALAPAVAAPPTLGRLAGDDAREFWEKEFSPEQRRAVLRYLGLTVVIHKRTAKHRKNAPEDIEFRINGQRVEMV